jgi:ABC transporter substrate binding protein
MQGEYRWAAGDADNIRKYAAELVAIKPDVILGNGTPSVTSLRQATRTVPIVFVQVTDPVGARGKFGASWRQCHRLYKFRVSARSQASGGNPRCRLRGRRRSIRRYSIGGVLPRRRTQAHWGTRPRRDRAWRRRLGGSCGVFFQHRGCRPGDARSLRS